MVFSITCGNCSIGDEEPVNESSPPSGSYRILPPLIQEKVREIPKYEVREDIVEIPEVQYVNKYVEVPSVIRKENIIHVKNPIYRERERKVVKETVDETVIEVPQVQLTERIVEVPQYVYEEKIVEVPKVVVQERVVPINKKVYREKLVEVPEVDYKNLLEEEIRQNPDAENDSYYVDGEKYIEIPHVQQIYRNIMSPKYRHIPTPVEVSVVHYKPVPVEKIVDRNVPVPVELQVIQEFVCAKIRPKYKEYPVPIMVQRFIEHPVPREALSNPQLLPLYYETSDSNTLFLNEDGTPVTNNAPQEKENNGGSVEILAQRGYPQMPPKNLNFQAPPVQPPEYLYQDNNALFNDSNSQMFQAQNDFQTYSNSLGPFVEVQITPQAPGLPTTVHTNA